MILNCKIETDLRCRTEPCLKLAGVPMLHKLGSLLPGPVEGDEEEATHCAYVSSSSPAPSPQALLFGYLHVNSHGHVEILDVTHSLPVIGRFRPGDLGAYWVFTDFHLCREIVVSGAGRKRAVVYAHVNTTSGRLVVSDKRLL